MSASERIRVTKSKETRGSPDTRTEGTHCQGLLLLSTKPGYHGPGANTKRTSRPEISPLKRSPPPFHLTEASTETEMLLPQEGVRTGNITPEADTASRSHKSHSPHQLPAALPRCWGRIPPLQLTKELQAGKSSAIRGVSLQQRDPQLFLPWQPYPS